MHCTNSIKTTEIFLIQSVLRKYYESSMKNDLNVHTTIIEFPYSKDFKRIFCWELTRTGTGMYCSLKTRKIQFDPSLLLCSIEQNRCPKSGSAHQSVHSLPAHLRAGALAYIELLRSAGQASVRAGVQVTFTFSAGQREACWPLGVQGLLKISLFKNFQPPFCLASQCRQISAHKKVLGFLEKFKKEFIIVGHFPVDF